MPAENTDAAVDDSEIPAAAEENVREEVPQPVKRKVKRNLPLIYLDEPKEVIGVTKVYNANEIEVDGTYIFLYGIYVNPETELGLEAKKFLENVVKIRSSAAVLLPIRFRILQPECAMWAEKTSTGCW